MYPHISKDIIRKKQIYPYSYFDSLEKYNTKEFPDISYFYNDLKKKIYHYQIMSKEKLYIKILIVNLYWITTYSM